MATGAASLLLILLLPLVILSCQDNPAAGPPPPSLPEFPNIAGTQWTYLYETPLLPYSDTVHTVVGETATLPSGAGARIWRITRSTGRDSQFVRHTGDTIQIFDASRKLIAVYLWPPVVGRGWSFAVEPGQFDTAFVAGKDTVLSPAGTFTDAYRVERESVAPSLSSSYNDTTWLVPGVGIAEQRVALVRNLQLWYWKLTLLSYSPAP